MPFNKEPTAYIKSALSDLQGAWENLRDEVVENFGFQDCDKMMFHIDEAMSWESVRNLDHMRDMLLLIENIAAHTTVPEDVQFWLENTRSRMENVMSLINQGEVL